MTKSIVKDKRFIIYAYNLSPQGLKLILTKYPTTHSTMACAIAEVDPQMLKFSSSSAKEFKNCFLICLYCLLKCSSTSYKFYNMARVYKQTVPLVKSLLNL